MLVLALGQKLAAWKHGDQCHPISKSRRKQEHGNMCPCFFFHLACSGISSFFVKKHVQRACVRAERCSMACASYTLPDDTSLCDLQMQSHKHTASTAPCGFKRKQGRGSESLSGRSGHDHLHDRKLLAGFLALQRPKTNSGNNSCFLFFGPRARATRGGWRRGAGVHGSACLPSSWQRSP